MPQSYLCEHKTRIEHDKSYLICLSNVLDIREILVVKPPYCIHFNFYEQSGWTVGVQLLLVSLLGM